MSEMHPLARQAVGRLAAAGVRLDPAADFGLLTHMDALARIIGNVADDSLARSIILPGVGLGNVVLKRLSIGARIFLQEQAQAWFEGKPGEWKMALAYAMSLSGRPEQLWRFDQDRAGFLAAVEEWCKTVAVNFETLVGAVDRLMATRPPSPLPPLPNQAPPDWWGLLEGICREFGQTPEHWFWVASEDDVAAILAKRNARVERENRAITSAGGQVVAPDPDAVWIRARVELRRFVDKLISERAPAAPPGADAAARSAPDKAPRPGRTAGAP